MYSYKTTSSILTISNVDKTAGTFSCKTTDENGNETLRDNLPIQYSIDLATKYGSSDLIDFLQKVLC